MAINQHKALRPVRRCSLVGLTILTLLALSGAAQAAEQSETELSMVDRLAQLDKLDSSQWGIHNGCIRLSRVVQINFIDDQTALLKLRGSKQAILRLQRECPGIAKQGFALINRSGRLCEGFDSVAVVGDSFSSTGLSVGCLIDSISPHPGLQ